MALLTAIMNLDFAQLFVAGAGVLTVIGMATGSSSEPEDDDDYETASWNPASVNYNG
jgi:hypothetical protein